MTCFEMWQFISVEYTSSTANQRPTILTGNLPDDFLRIDNQASSMQMWPQQPMFATGAAGFLPTYYQKGGILTVTVAQVAYYAVCLVDMSICHCLMWYCPAVNRGHIKKKFQANQG